MKMGVSCPDVFPAGNLPSACQAAHCHCPLLFQGDLTNKIDRALAFFLPPILYVQNKTKMRHMSKLEVQAIAFEQS